MSTSQVASLVSSGIQQVISVIGPILGIALIVGLIVAIFQAVTSIQEQTLTFLPKLLVILVVIALLANSIFTDMREFAIELFKQIPNFAK